MMQRSIPMTTPELQRFPIWLRPHNRHMKEQRRPLTLLQTFRGILPTRHPLSILIVRSRIKNLDKAVCCHECDDGNQYDESKLSFLCVQVLCVKFRIHTRLYHFSLDSQLLLTMSSLTRHGLQMLFPYQSLFSTPFFLNLSFSVVLCFILCLG
ncbi:hypothetical protein BGW80DRAFT_417672 [Lactifluus volemus]|nr:hypothetical protein BGW80DRAFT_417672 [Lactifluus volemus]